MCNDGNNIQRKIEGKKGEIGVGKNAVCVGMVSMCDLNLNMCVAKESSQLTNPCCLPSIPCSPNAVYLSLD